MIFRETGQYLRSGPGMYAWIWISDEEQPCPCIELRVLTERERGWVSQPDVKYHRADPKCERCAGRGAVAREQP